MRSVHRAIVVVESSRQPPTLWLGRSSSSSLCLEYYRVFISRDISYRELCTVHIIIYTVWQKHYRRSHSYYQFWVALVYSNFILNMYYIMLHLYIHTHALCVWRRRRRQWLSGPLACRLSHLFDVLPSDETAPKRS